MRCKYMSPKEYYGMENTFGGHQSVKRWYYELEEADTPEIVSQIEEFIKESGQLPPKDFTVFLYCEVSEDTAELSVDPYDYVTREEMEKLL